MNFKDELRKKILVIDGAMGTMQMALGIKPEDNFDLQSLKRPDDIRNIHRAYFEAGADIIETNTFGANRIKLAEYGMADRVDELNQKSVELVKEASNGKAFVCGSIGPIGKLLEPMGTLTFDEAYEVFAQQAKALAKAGADVISVETISDLQEMRAGIIAVKSATDLPVIASMTYDEGEVTISGTTPEAACVVLEALGADVISANCSAGPQGLLKVAKRLIKATNLPIMIMPNAGMPALEKGKAIYKMTPEEFARHGQKSLELGIRIIGGCCGTMPAHIRALKSEILKSKSETISKLQIPISKLRFASRSKVVGVDGFLSVGERINPTGRKYFREELKQGKFKIVRAEAEGQTKAGAELLDVNVSVAKIDDVKAMKHAVFMISTASEQPLSIDSPNPAAIEAGLKSFCGRALVNSVNGKQESLDIVLPLVKKYGAAVIGLALDEKGIPKTVDEKVEIARRIIKAADAYAIPRENIFIDNLVMTVGVGIDEALQTLEAIPIVKKKFGVKTILGISNVSHGMPNRSRLNGLYLKLCILNGLDAGIIDITDPETKKAVNWAEKVKKQNKEVEFKKILKEFKEAAKGVKGGRGKGKGETEEKIVEKNYSQSLKGVEQAVIEGDDEAVRELTNNLLKKGEKPQEIIDQALVKGMEFIGRQFSAKKIYLPQVMASAEAMKVGFALCKEKIPKEEVKKVGKIILATVKGDVHDIGKNIVKMMLENHGFEVIDLGKDVPSQKILEAAKKERPNAICLSALLTTTMMEMEEVSKALKAEGLDIPVMIGGAVVTDDYAQEIGASYSADAVGAVSLAKKIISQALKNRK